MNFCLHLFVVCLLSLGSFAITFEDYSNHSCIRECNGISMICEYDFVIERMFTLEDRYCKSYSKHCIVADNKQVIITTVNRQLPGPAIQVCKGDEIRVNVKNHLIDQTTSIHWHGQHQVKTPFMDGVPMVTQCPINPMTSFQYRFLATQSGTHFYHSHSGFQRVNGFYGALIARDTESDNKISGRYDFDEPDHVIIVTDWMANPTESHYSVERLGKFKDLSFPILVNGYGKSSPKYHITEPTFKVKKDRRYRFRVIHAGALPCAISLTIENHVMEIVSTDGNDIESIEVRKTTVTPGERSDFILKADKKCGSSHKMTFQGGSVCFQSATHAILKYTDDPGSWNNIFPALPSTNFLEFNCINKDSDSHLCVPYAKIKSLEKMDETLKGTPDFKYLLSFNMIMQPIDAFKDTSALISSTPVFNNITFRMPSTTLLGSNSGDVKTCNRENMENCEGTTLCECTHVVEIPLNSRVELVLIAETFPFIFHPMHFHGHYVYVLASEKLHGKVTYERIKTMDALNELKRNFNDPPLKDTITPPTGGYSIVRFRASNPGYWLVHCHIETHMEMGMALVIKVGDPKKPPKGFPKCGNYVSNLDLL